MGARSRRISSDSCEAVNVINTRICDGVHYRTSGEVRCGLGTKVGELTLDKLLR